MKENGAQPIHALIRSSFGVAAGCAMAAAGLSPTGQVVLDWLLLIACGVVVSWASSSVPWWLIAVVGGVAAGLASTPVYLMMSLAGVLIAVIDARGPWPRVEWFAPLSAALVTIGLSGIDVGTAFGRSSAVALTLGVVLVVVGVIRRDPIVRRRAVLVGAICTGVVIVAVIGLGIGGLASRSQLSDATDIARSGLKALARGDVDTARQQFDRATTAFSDASDDLGAPWTQPARLVPVIAQHRNGAAELSEGASAATRRIATVLEGLDIDSVRIDDGRIDIDSVRALREPLIELRATIDDLDNVLDDADNPWLVAPMRTRILDVRDDIVSYREQADTAISAVTAAPAILGEDSERVYFIAFTTPSEARGSIGFMGNYAELTITDGKLEMTRFGRSTDLNKFPNPNRRVTGLDDFLGRFGAYGFNNGPNGTTAEYVWQVITISPDFPTVGAVIANLYPQSGGQTIDGVFALDPAALGGLLKFTGPIRAEGVPQALDQDNVEEFLNVQQYIELTDKPSRVDSLESVASATIQAVLGGALPGPRELGETLSPLVRQRHIAGWFVDDAEQSLATTLGMDHALPTANVNGDIALSVNNSGASKIDAYALIDVHYTRRWDDNVLAGAIDVTIENTAPSGGLPLYVIQNVRGEPQGTNVSYVSVYLPLPPSEMTIDGQPVETIMSTERGLYVASAYVTIPSKGSRTLHVEYSGPSPSAPSRAPEVVGPDARRPPTIVITAD